MSAPIDVTQLKRTCSSYDSYDPDDRQQDYYVTTTITYRGKEIFKEVSHSSCHIGGLGGHTHTSSLDGTTLTITTSGVGKWSGDPKTVRTVDLAAIIAEQSRGGITF